MTWGGILAFIGILSYTTWTQVGGGNSLPPDEVADPWLGAEEAKVEIIEFGDFGCHACQAWHNLGIREQVLAQYGDQVRFTWRDFPVITNQSPKAAEAGHCAGAQGKFWEFHDHVYENQVGLGRSQLESYAEAVGLDLAAFGQCLDEKNMTLKVQENEQIARRFGIRGTPGFVLNGQVLASPPTYPFLSSLIERELAAE
ncbi:MAG: thioredoxin domain-containing protein [Chloroflexota bacterium]